MAQLRFDHLIGVPFVDGGRDPATGLDCWGMLMAACLVFGRVVEDFKISCFSSAAIYLNAVNEISEKKAWHPVGQAAPGAVITLALDDHYPGLIQHFGVMIDNHRFIHTLLKTGGIVTPVTHPFFKGKIIGYYQ